MDFFGGKSASGGNAEDHDDLVEWSKDAQGKDGTRDTGDGHDSQAQVYIIFTNFTPKTWRPNFFL